jgi:hypothetical protein
VGTRGRAQFHSSDTRLPRALEPPPLGGGMLGGSASGVKPRRLCRSLAAVKLIRGERAANKRMHATRDAEALMYNQGCGAGALCAALAVFW